MSVFYELKDLSATPVLNGITMKAVYGEKSSIAFVELPAYSRIPLHHHSSEQIGIVLEGEIEYTVEGETKICGKGSMFIVPPNAHHSLVVVSNKTAKLIDIFTPKRELTKALNYVETPE